jgi:sugar porter (SP) family MFS transporter
MHDETTGGSLAYLGLISLVAALGGLLFGFDTAVISGTIGYWAAEYGIREDAARIGWIASSALVGCMAGALVAGWLSDRFGRKRVLLLSAVLFTVSAVWCGMPSSADALVVARIVGGVGVGIASMVSPMYIAEVSPPRIRGRMVSLQQFTIISGILAAYFCNKWIDGLELTDGAKWRWMFAAEALPAGLFFFALFGVPESPRWLTRRGLADRASGILSRVVGPGEAEREMREIHASLAQEGGTLAELLRPGLRLALGIGVVLAVLQQVTGINAILYYAPEIFKKAGGDASAAYNDTIWIGVFNLLFTLVAIALIDRLGRKILLIAGAAGMGISLLLVGLAFQSGTTGGWLLVVILAYVSCFAASLGPVVWVVMSEIYPTRIRGRAMSVATVVLWAACYLVSQTFPMVVQRWGSAAAFWGYAVMCVLTIVFVALFVPETKGRSLEEIERMWRTPEPPPAGPPGPSA